MTISLTALVALLGAVQSAPKAPPSGPKVNTALTNGFFVRDVSFEYADRRFKPSLDVFSALPRQRVELSSAGLLFSPSGAGESGEASIELPIVEGPAFREALVSWNAHVPEGLGLIVELRVAAAQGSWSPWLHVGDWGLASASTRVTKFEGGRIDTDYFRSDRAWDRTQLRTRAWSASEPGATFVTVERIGVCTSDRTTVHDRAWAQWDERRKFVGNCSVPGMRGLPEQWTRRLPVPFRSQKAEDPKIAGHICSPTSVAMVLAYRGVDRPTAEVADRLYDREHAIYGNWPRAVQGAFALGVPGYLTRYSSWKAVEDVIGSGQPLVISIAAEKGQLTGAPYEKTDGHLLVLCGFDAKGDCLVNDPAAADAEHGQITYARSELEACWMGHGGVAYVLLPRPEQAK